MPVILPDEAREVAVVLLPLGAPRGPLVLLPLPEVSHKPKFVNGRVPRVMPSVTVAVSRAKCGPRMRHSRQKAGAGGAAARPLSRSFTGY